MALEWFVIHAYSNYEAKVRDSLKERIMLNNLDDKFGDIIVPTEEVVEIKNGEKKGRSANFSQAMSWSRWR